METSTLSSGESSSFVELQKFQDDVFIALEESSQPTKGKVYETCKIMTPKIVTTFAGCKINDIRNYYFDDCSRCARI